MREINEKIAKETEMLFSDDAAIIGLYEEVLIGKRKAFPMYTWELPNALYYAKVLTKYLIEVKLQWTIDDVKQKLSGQIIRKYRLKGMERALFNSFYEMVNNAYPDVIKPWEFKTAPHRFWQSDENKKEALQWLFETKLQWNIEDIKQKFNKETLNEHGFGGIIEYFSGSPHQIVEFLYPGQTQPWEYACVSHKYWEDDEHKIKALKWLFEDKLQWDLDEIKKKLSRQIFTQYGLKGLVTNYFNDSPYQVIIFLYPDAIMPWEIKKPPRGIYNSENNQRKALIWFFEEKLKWSINEIDEKLTSETLVKSELKKLFTKYFEQNPYKVAKFLYPNEPFEKLKERSIKFK